MSEKKKVPLVRPTLPDWSEIEPQFAEIWQSGRLSCGLHTLAFEKSMCEATGAQHAVAMSSCTSGLMLLMRALNITGEVILPSFTWASTGHALVWNQITPVFADCTPGTLTLDPQDVRKRLTTKTQAILAANVFGLHPDMDALFDVAQQAGVPLLCDSAQAFGATYKGCKAGNIAHAEVFSLSPTKVVTAVEGGVVTTNDSSLAQTLRQMRDYGKSSDGLDIESFGLSARFSELHAVIGRANLDRYADLAQSRRQLANRYVELLGGVDGISFQTIPEGYRSAYNYFVILLEKRNELQAHLAAENIESKRYFFPPLHRQKSYACLSLPDTPLPVTEQAGERCLALPFYSHMPLEQVENVADAVLRFLGHR